MLWLSTPWLVVERHWMFAIQWGDVVLAYDIQPIRPEISLHDIRRGFPAEAADCDLIFCDPPYHTMLARQYSPTVWRLFHFQSGGRFSTIWPAVHSPPQDPAVTWPFCWQLRPRKTCWPDLAISTTLFLAIRLQFEAGFQPERRISCPMEGAYLPQQVRSARREGRLLGQVRDLLILRKNSRSVETQRPNDLNMQGLLDS